MSVPALEVANLLGLLARRICSGCFLLGLGPEEVLKNIGPGDEHDIKVRVDQGKKRVSVTYNGRTRSAHFLGDQGSVLPAEGERIYFKPVRVRTTLPRCGVAALADGRWATVGSSSLGYEARPGSGSA